MSKLDTSDEQIAAIADVLLGWLTGPDDGQNDGLMDAYNALHALLRERNAARAAWSWRPPETAPRDGTWILGINNRGNQAVIIWSEEAFDRGSGRVVPGWIHPFSTMELSSFWNGYCGSVLEGWMPLPPRLPKPGGAAGGAAGNPGLRLLSGCCRRPW